MTNQTIQQMIETTKEERAKYSRTPGENANQRWDRVHLAKWRDELEVLESIIHFYETMSVDELLKKLEAGNIELGLTHKRKAKLEALIAKYTDPEYVASRVTKK